MSEVELKKFLLELWEKEADDIQNENGFWSEYAKEEDREVRVAEKMGALRGLNHVMNQIFRKLDGENE